MRCRPSDLVLAQDLHGKYLLWVEVLCFDDTHMKNYSSSVGGSRHLVWCSASEPLLGTSPDTYVTSMSCWGNVRDLTFPYCHGNELKWEKVCRERGGLMPSLQNTLLTSILKALEARETIRLSPYPPPWTGHRVGFVTSRRWRFHLHCLLHQRTPLAIPKTPLVESSPPPPPLSPS